MHPHRPAASLFRLPRRTLRMQLALLYAGVFVILGVAMLAAAGLLVRSGSASGGSAGSAFNGGSPGAVGRQFDVGPALVFAVAVLLALGLGWLIAGRLLRPLRTITATARDISASNLNRRLGLGGRNDEFAELGETLDGLFERLEASFQSQRHFVANASHELRTPLAAERTLLQVALADPDATAQTLRSTCQDLLALGDQQDASSTPCSPWPAANVASKAGSPSISPRSQGRRSWTAARMPSAAASASTPFWPRPRSPVTRP